MGLCDRLFLAHYSLDAFEGCVTGSALASVFQHSCIRITTMAQVFVGLYMGANRKQEIGKLVWQMIWFSLISMVITTPLGMTFSPLFFNNTPVAETGMIYFKVMNLGNFLYPLATALSSYYIGRGKMRIVFTCTFLANILNIGLDYLMIFGLPGLFPSLGILGASLATIISQTSFCLVLFAYFVRKKEREEFGTGNFAFRWQPFWEQTRLGLFRAAARIIILANWVAIAHIMSMKGGDYLLVLSVGSTLILLFTFINDGMCQGMITMASHLMGAGMWKYLRKMVVSSLLFLSGATLLLSIPYFISPDSIIALFNQTPLSPEKIKMLKRACIGLWLFFFGYGFNAIGLSLITAARDIKFYLIAASFVCLTSFTPIYIGINFFNWPAESLWYVMAFDSFAIGLVLFLRVNRKWIGYSSDEEEQLSAKRF
jgi:MATE family multidrug resistance protein